MKKLSLILAPVAVLASQAHAALPEAVTAGITTASGDLVALFGALTTAGIAVFVARVIYNKFKVR